jgi:hypothetical protein
LQFVSIVENVANLLPMSGSRRGPV